MTQRDRDEAPSLDQLLAAARTRLAPLTDQPAQEARWLAEQALDCATAALIVAGPRTVSPDDQARLEALVTRRVAGEPLAYVLGRAPFRDFDLSVTPDTLVPRADTETLVQAVLDRLPADKALCIVDLGTGSGAIALALALERPCWRIHATDTSANALAVARANAARLKQTDICFAAGSWFSGLPVQTRFDAIVSNPPYIAADDAHLGALVAEPRSALVSGSDGLADLVHLVDGAKAHLAPGGLLALEHGWNQAPEIRHRMLDQGFERVETIDDPGRNPRVTLGWRSSAG